MSQGLYRNAGLTLRRALEELKHYTKSMSSFDTSQEENLVQVYPGKARQEESTRQLYTTPFHISLLSDEDEEQEQVGAEFISEQDVNLLSATLLFNMALAHQLNGSLTVDTKKAIAFYRLALTTSQRTDILDRADIALLAVAIGNNLAACFAELFLYEQLASCLEWTLDTAEEMMGDYSFFWTNLVQWQNTQCLSAAAA